MCWFPKCIFWICKCKIASSKGCTPNFSKPERILLAELGKEFPNIGDKGYDGRSVHKKERAWSQLLTWFNAVKSIYLKQIQGHWKRLKLKAKKDFDFQCWEFNENWWWKALPSPDKVSKMVENVIPASVKGKQGSTEHFPKIEVHPCGFWGMLWIEFSFAFLARNLGSKTQLFP